MNRQFERYLQMTLTGLDLLVLNVLYLLCKIIFAGSIPDEHMDLFFQYWAISNGLWILLSFFFGTYGAKVILQFEHFTKRTFQVYLLWIVSILFYLFFFREFQSARLFIISTIVSFGVGLLLTRFLYLGIRNYYKNSNNLIKKVIILGYNE